MLAAAAAGRLCGAISVFFEKKKARFGLGDGDGDGDGDGGGDGDGDGDGDGEAERLPQTAMGGRDGEVDS